MNLFDQHTKDIAIYTPQNMPEKWCPVVGYEGMYEVSNLGKVRSLPRIVESKNGTRRTLQGKLLKVRTLPGGHMVCNLWKNNKGKHFYIHRLVAIAFLGEGLEGTEVCHNDGNPANNWVGNLRWDTRSENVLDEVRSRRHWQSAKTHCKRGHEFTPENTLVSGITRVQRVCRECKRSRR